MAQKTSLWTKLVYLLGALLAFSAAGLVLYGPEAVSEVAPQAAGYVPDDQRIAYMLAGLGVFLLGAAFLARLRSLIGLVLVTAATVAVHWAAIYGDFNVWLLAVFWSLGFIGVFAVLIYLIAFFRGRDVA